MMAKLNTLQGLMELVEAAGGEIDTRIRIQKEAFLLAASNVGRFQTSLFSYYHYGPYSRDLSDALQFSVSSNLLREIREPTGDNGYKYTYSLTDEGRRFLKERDNPSDEISKLGAAMSKYHWRALELAATVRFLEIREKASTREAAFTEALRLKPETKNYEAKAQELLEKVLH